MDIFDPAHYRGVRNNWVLDQVLDGPGRPRAVRDA